MLKRPLLLLAVLSLLSACSSTSDRVKRKDDSSPATYQVTLDTTKGPIVIEVHRDWAPAGADRFYTLVKSGYLDGARFFRVIPGFIAQFGLAADAKTTSRWEGTELPDDPVRQSNTRGMVTFATRGPNSRTTQLFINTGNNARLDGDGFAPFARVTSGMEAVDEFYGQYGEQPDQGQIKEQGNLYLEKVFPRLDGIRTARITG